MNVILIKQSTNDSIGVVGVALELIRILFWTFSGQQRCFYTGKYMCDGIYVFDWDTINTPWW